MRIQFDFGLQMPKFAMNFKIIFLFIAFCAVNLTKSQTSSEDYKLSNTTRPVSYIVLLSTAVPEAARRFTGVMSLQIRVVEDTKEIVLNSRDHLDFEVQLYSEGNTLIDGINLLRQSADVIKITTQDNLVAGSLYTLIMSYRGNLLLASDGFFRSDYVVNENGSDKFT